MYQIGDVIDGEYFVLRVFTNGGMGIVYKTHQKEWDMDIAMKCPKKELFGNENSIKTFVKECRTWMAMGLHPNIVTCFYVKNIDSYPAIFIEYVDGGSLADQIKNGTIYANNPYENLKKILDIAIQTARGLEFAHKKGYIHQDVKPANILMTQSGVAKVSDFGLSKASQGLTSLAPQSRQIDETARSIIVSSGGCTPAYCAPEQILNRPLTRRTDIWSWALIVLELIHGGKFWRFGAEASRSLTKLWGWQIFSPKVKRCPELINLLKECLNEQEEKRPHDFSSVVSRLESIYASLFGSYPKHRPSDTLLLAETLCNRIASYSALCEFGEDTSHEIYETLSALRKNPRWALWGEINSAVHYLKTGKRICDIKRMLQNVLHQSADKDGKRWIVNFFLNTGVTSPRQPVFAKSIVGEELRSSILSTHKRLQRELRQCFNGAKHCTNPFEENEHGYLVARTASQNGKCIVTISATKQPAGKSDDYCHFAVEAKTENGLFVCDDKIPGEMKIRFVTTDDNATFISLWLDKNSSIVYRKVIRREDNRIIPYIPDYRTDEKWGCLARIFQSGDGKRLMTISQTGKCSVWINDDANPKKDGRNVCEICLKDYGIIPPEVLLPNLFLEDGFECEINNDAGYRLLDFLASKFGDIRHPCRIFLPDSSEEAERRCRTGLSRIDKAKQAVEKGMFVRAAQLLSEAVSYDVMPSEELLKLRHAIVVSDEKAVIDMVWLEEESKEHWVHKTALYPAEGGPAYESFTATVTTDDKSSDLKDFVILKPLRNGDVIALPLQKNVWWNAIGIGRYRTNNGNSHLAKVWEYNFTTPENQLLENCSSWITFSDDGIKVILPKSKKHVILNVNYGTIVSERQYDHSLTWRNVRKDVVAVRNTKIRCVEWGVVYEDIASGRSEVIIKYPKYGWWCPRICVSQDGLAVAIVVLDKLKLLVYCVNSHKIVFEWTLPDGKFQDMCFDKTGRFLSLLYDYHNVLTFQLFWNFVRG